MSGEASLGKIEGYGKLEKPGCGCSQPYLAHISDGRGLSFSCGFSLLLVL